MPTSTRGGLPIVFLDYLARWGLTPDGAPVITPTSRLLPVRAGGAAAMLKIAALDEERLGNRLMGWWNGEGAARVLAQDQDAILMERAENGRRSLADIARGGGDDLASRMICSVLAKLHAPRPRPAPVLPTLAEWFEGLGRAAKAQGGGFRLAAATTANLLASPRETAVLHGDMHHGNVLDFGARGWLAIDPKGLVGERSFDYANTFCNPDHETATQPGRLARQLQIVADCAHLEPNRLLAWIIAWAGLSAAFSLEDGLNPDSALKVGELAAAELTR